jgi:putative cell wall-binding protein
MNFSPMELLIRINKVMALVLILFSSQIGVVFASTNRLDTQQTVGFTRLSGQTRYETAKAISEYYNPEKVQHVILSNGNDFADGLSASVLAHQKEAPILSVDSTVASSQDALNYITNHLSPTGTVYIIGGTGAIGSEFETKLKNLGFQNSIRFAGTDRYDTSYQLARSLDNSLVSTVVISSGETYPDALSIASFAANKGWPILLTPKNALPKEMKEYLTVKKPSNVYITGGAGVISNQVESEIKGLLPQASVQRLAGQDRFDTNTAIAQTFNPNPSTVFLATGYDFADSLAGSAFAAKKGCPILLMNSNSGTIPLSTLKYLVNLEKTGTKPSVIVLGGSGAIDNAMVNRVVQFLEGTLTETSIQSIDQFINNSKRIILKLNEEFTLPTTVTAKLYNEATKQVSVTWKQKLEDGTEKELINNDKVDTRRDGSTSSYIGFVDGYSNLEADLAERNTNTLTLEAWIFNGLNMTEDTVSTRFEGKTLDLILPIYIESNRYYLPLTEIINKAGGKITKLDNKITFEINHNRETIDITNNSFDEKGQLIKLKKNCIVIGDFVYISMVDFCRMLNLKVDWNIKPKVLSFFYDRAETVRKQLSNTGKIALLRLEDIAPGYLYNNPDALQKLRIITDYLYSKNIPFHVAWVPRYIDPRPSSKLDNDLSQQNIMVNADFIYTLDYMAEKNGWIGLHGYTHQYGNSESVGGSEFNAYPNDGIPGTVQYTQGRVDMAIAAAKKLDISYSFFEVPHYAISSKLSKVLEKNFDVLYGPYPSTPRQINVSKNEENTTIYVPTPLDYVNGPSDLPNMLYKIRTIKPSALASFFYHPYLEFKDIEILKSSDGYPLYNYAETSILHRIVEVFNDGGYQFTTVNGLK